MLVFRLERDTGALHPGIGRGRRRGWSKAAAYAQQAATRALCLQPAASSSAHLGGDTGQAGVGVGAQGPPWVRPTVANGPQDKALG